MLHGGQTYLKAFKTWNALDTLLFNKTLPSPKKLLYYQPTLLNWKDRQLKDVFKGLAAAQDYGTSNIIPS